MEVTIRVPTALRELVGQQPRVTIEVDGDPGATGDGAVTVGTVLDTLGAAHPMLERRIRDERGRPREHVNVFVGPDNIRDLDGLDTALRPHQELSIIPAISGG